MSGAPLRTREDTVTPPWPGELREVDGRRLFVRTASQAPGRAESAVLVHGLGGSSLNWTDLMGLLADRVHCAAPDLPGFGESPPPSDGDYSTAAHASAVIRLVESLDAGPVHLFGNSLGGAVATRVSAERPELVRTLTLVSPALPDLRPRLSSASLPLLAAPGVGGLIARRLARRPVEQRVDDMLALCFADPAAVPKAQRQQAVEVFRRRLAMPHADEALLATLRGLVSEYLGRGTGALWRLAGRVQAPTLVVYGGRDKLVNARMARRAAATFPRARVVVLPRCGHVAQMEHPEVVAREFLEMAQPAG